MLEQLIHSYNSFTLLTGQTVGQGDVFSYVQKGRLKGISDTNLAKTIKVLVEDKQISLVKLLNA